MKVLIEGTWWLDGPVSNRQVLREIVFAWHDSFPEDELHITIPKKSLKLALPQLPPNTRVHGTFLGQHALVSMIEIPIIAWRLKPDVVLNQNFATLFGKRSTIFLHDVLFESNREWFTLLERMYFSIMKKLIRRSELVITSSRAESTRINHYHPDVHPRAVGLAPGSELTKLEGKRPPKVSESMDFILAVGRLNIRKNLEYAVEIATSSELVSKSCPLIIVGSRQGKSSQLEKLRKLEHSGAIIFTGYLPAEELVWLYSKARAMIFMSRGEGFGLPVVEAMHFGCPVIASDIEVLREVTGGNAVFLPLDDSRKAVEIIRTLESGVLGELSWHGKEFISNNYSWSQTVNNIRTAMNNRN